MIDDTLGMVTSADLFRLLWFPAHESADLSLPREVRDAHAIHRLGFEGNYVRHVVKARGR